MNQYYLITLLAFFIYCHRSSTFPHFGITPLPIRGKVGIKFDNNQDGKTITQAFLKHGYKAVQKETEGLAFLYQQIAPVTMRSVD